MSVKTGRETFLGISLRDAVREARVLGIEVRIARRTGELVFRADGFKTYRVNSRRKDTPRCVSMLLRDVLAARGGR